MKVILKLILETFSNELIIYFDIYFILLLFKSFLCLDFIVLP